MKTVTINKADIADRITVCPYCMSEVEEGSFRGCCGESSAHFEDAYVVEVNGEEEVYLVSEVTVVKEKETLTCLMINLDAKFAVSFYQTKN